MEPSVCPDCDYYSEVGEYVCGRTCDRAPCVPCAYDRWAEANPLEAAIEDAHKASDRAQHAEEAAWENWRDYAREERAAWAYVRRLERELGEGAPPP